jgi:hypothetical protein
MSDPITDITYSYRDGNRDRWTLILQRIGIHFTDDYGDWVWGWVLSCENGDRLSGQHTGQYDMTPKVEDILVPIARNMVSLSVGFSMDAKAI